LAGREDAQTEVSLPAPIRSRSRPELPLRTPSPPTPAGGQAGFTVIEVLVAAVVLLIGLLSASALLDSSTETSAATNEREQATNLARQIIEDAQTIPYAQISPNAIVGQLQAMSGLADETAGPAWQISRRGIPYTVTVTECALDDPKDGLGRHVNSYGENWFCEGQQESSGKEANEDSTPEDLKRVTVDVRWKALGRSPDVHQVALLSSAGAAPGLAASELHLEKPSIGDGVTGSPTQATVTEEPLSETLTFKTSAPAATTGVRWSLEGITQTSPATKTSATTWTFAWPIPLKTVSDGTYDVSVQAIDSAGVAGPPVSIPITLIRATPAAVSGLKGGFNEVSVSGVLHRVAEIEWQANTERNVIGYQVTNPSGQRVCPESEGVLSTALSCIDFHPPSPSAANLTYSVSALYRNASGAVTLGPPGKITLSGLVLSGPGAPTKLEQEKSAEGPVVLKWEAPTTGEPVAFYRIYRGSTDYTGRYGVSSTTSFTDTDAVTSHTYWVTAVTATLKESAFLGPVSG
jgi:prepilin-type N-terminal cleavage/methylation domain-containing protein